MRMKRLATLAAVLASILTVPTTVVAGDQQEQDRAAIEALMWHYARALDTFNPDAYAALFTEDGSFKAGQNATTGRKALWDMINNYKKDREERKAKGETIAPMYHMNADTWIEFIDADHARHHSYWFTVVSGTGQDAQTRILAAGVGVDEVVKVNGQWLIKLRDVSPQE
jgi:uncharacterized protein (TIGR02246 family)